MRHLLVVDNRCFHRTAGYDGAMAGMAGNIGKHWKTAEEDAGR